MSFPAFVLQVSLQAGHNDSEGQPHAATAGVCASLHAQEGEHDGGVSKDTHEFVVAAK